MMSRNSMLLPIHLRILKAILLFLPRQLKSSIYMACIKNRCLSTSVNSYVFKLPFGLALKTFKGPTEVEASALRFVGGLQCVHIPLCIDAFATQKRSFLLTKWVEGDNVGYVWDQLDRSDKKRLVQELRMQLQALRDRTSTTATRTICNAAGGAVADFRLPWILDDPRTFSSCREFSEQVWLGLDWPGNQELRALIRPMIDRSNVPIVLSHGDILRKNLVLPGGLEEWRKGDEMVCILDWEYAGWMPYWWDALKATWMEVDEDSEWLLMAREFLPDCVEALDIDWQWRSRSRVTLV